MSVTIMNPHLILLALGICAAFGLLVWFGMKSGEASQSAVVLALARMGDQLAEAETACEALQAQVDALMMEFCPDEMTPEQRARWAASQVAA